MRNSDISLHTDKSAGQCAEWINQKYLATLLSTNWDEEDIKLLEYENVIKIQMDIIFLKSITFYHLNLLLKVGRALHFSFQI